MRRERATYIDFRERERERAAMLLLCSGKADGPGGFAGSHSEAGNGPGSL